MSQLLGVNLEKTAREANNDFILTREELMAIFLAHVPTSSDGYAEITAAFESKLDELDFKKINKEIEEEVKKGNKNPVIKIPVTLDIAGQTEVIPVEVTTNIDVTLNETKTVQYDITHSVKINGVKVEQNPAAVQTRIDEVTGELVSWFGTTTTAKDTLVAKADGRKFSATLTDSSTDPIVEGGKVYRANIIGMDAELKSGDPASTVTAAGGYAVLLTDVKAPVNGDQAMSKTLDPFGHMAIGMTKNQYVGLLDVQSDTYVLVTEAEGAKITPIAL